MPNAPEQLSQPHLDAEAIANDLLSEPDSQKRSDSMQQYLDAGLTVEDLEKVIKYLEIENGNFYGLLIQTQQDTIDLLEQAKDGLVQENNPVNPNSIEVKSEDFDKLVAFIEREGFLIKEPGVSCDHQYTFFDKNGNRHAMMAIKRDANGKPSKQGSVKQISVWAYHQGIRDQEHYFGYIITAEEIAPSWRLTPEEKSEVRKAYNEILEKIKT
ncbi:MAG: hypothetical protein UR28_C0020G0007 [Candidatus Peregrinibacteria bacterium GW2011_GWF2_33_10]|nr:MAG: hypothetical protein UR28_C0020G0007 [Candidatus Peregrinibacteria bacterium GW2011_GWF2_33_10]OGJ45310.1 MAG: hypothetical protein A2272_06160 [Candidatus Peregrinibacteria bacterium RIFOXYA12_FULL_33_12]OGJ45398.1 MAG: hypothetical protein A2263_03980 [Candidatus Peregrinibacteria bacterium RIFOXYA2_FULL_33_21]OGJ51001.1 MAG: hypothetical protein A2307_05575 [Candidatus Peregrinibacteria bacterium RIFOXYB2_FULL_33_20]